MSAKGRNKMNKNVFSYNEDVVRMEISRLFGSDDFMTLLSNTHYAIYKYHTYDVDGKLVNMQPIILN